ncbi:hypothetical protein QBC47DRAFT_378899 [Echria macrotheca]|uniref:Uncharacterized protein n=1 Tax=Echria macrotheca TaxID=438768 RepID=A0AAJ0BEY9_9PEZI|nr:hypothetical protein QBC47DRAFT_378899 [Echria macrotheca]
MSGSRSPRDPFRNRRFSEYLQTITNPDENEGAATSAPNDELQRAIARFHQNVDRVLSAANATPSTLADMSSGSDRELRQRFNRDPPNSMLRPANSLPPLRALRRLNTLSSGESGSRSTRHRDRPSSDTRYRSVMGRDLPSLEDIQRASDETNSRIRTLLEQSSSPFLSQPAPSPPLQTSDPVEDSRRVKRRKLDSDKIGGGSKAVRYGRYGQLEPGQLTMEIVSCDGGVYPSDGLRDGSVYAAENILKNDNSVYCTRSYRCNIVLRHQGGTVFSLKELVIKAPATSRFNAPVREGMVFVSMDQDDLLTRTAQYQIQYLPSRAGLPPVYSIRHDDDIPRIRMRGYQPSNYYEDDDDECRAAHIPHEFTDRREPFSVATECSDDQSGDENSPGSQPPSRRPVNRIGTLPFESDGSDDGADVWGAPTTTNWTFDDIRLRSVGPSHLLDSERYRGRNSGGDLGGITLEEAREANQIATQEAVRAVGGSLMAPLAHFHIDKTKNKCTISFDPPVSARFLLLKIWTPYHDDKKNIDIQTVIAKGFAGPRYFPSVETR